MDNRIITTDVMEEDFSLEGNLRPQTLDEYIGQEKTKNTLKVYIEAAKQRHDSLDHVPRKASGMRLTGKMVHTVTALWLETRYILEGFCRILWTMP